MNAAPKAAWKLSTDLERRRAFTRSFHLWPVIAHEFAKRCSIKPVSAVSIRPNMPQGQEFVIAEIITAQFAVRCLQTRNSVVDCESEGLTEYVKAAVGRYKAFKNSRLPNYEIHAEAAQSAAMTTVQGDMCSVMFAAMSDLQHMPGQEFDEASFWYDAFIGLAETRTGSPGLVPNLVPALQAVLLGDLQEFAAVLYGAPRLPSIDHMSTHATRH